jgi:hypothetical protein
MISALMIGLLTMKRLAQVETRCYKMYTRSHCERNATSPSISAHPEDALASIETTDVAVLDTGA